MPRSTKESEDEVETRSGRRTRASALSVPGSPVRRTTRKKQTAAEDDNSSPESMASDVTVQTRRKRRPGTLDSVTSDTTRSLRPRKNSTASEASEIHESENEGRKRRTKKSPLIASGIDTATSTRLKRGTRAGSESRTISPVVRKTRKARASSVDLEITDDRPSSNPGTPVKGRKGRIFAFPSEPSVVEETEKLSKREDDETFETTNTTGTLSTSHGSTDSPKRSEKSAVSNDDEVQIQKTDDKETQEALGNSLEVLISQTAPEEDASQSINNEKQRLVDNANDNTLRDLPKVLIEKAQLTTKPIETMETSPGNKENDISYVEDRKKRSNTARRSSGSVPKKPINSMLEKAEIAKPVSRLSRDKSVLIGNDSPKSLNQDNVTVSMASIESQNDEIIVIDDTDTEEPEKSHESSKNRRKSLRLPKTVESEEVKTEVNEESNESSSKKPEIDDEIREKLDANEIDETENPENLFKDISAEEWNEKKNKGIENDSKVDSDVDCDLVLVGKGGWSADEVDDDKNEDNYDSDVTAIVTKGTDVSGNSKKSKNNEESIKIGEDEEEVDIDDGPGELSRESKSIQRKSLTKNPELSDEKLKRQSVVESLEDSVVPMEVDNDDKDSDGSVIKSRKSAGGDDSSDDEAPETDVGISSEVLDSSGKPRGRTSPSEARRSLMGNRNSLKLLDTDTSTDEVEEEKRKKKISEYEDHLNERVNKMRKSLNSRSPSDPKKSNKSEDEVEVENKKTSEVEGGKSRKSSAKEVRRSLTQLSNSFEIDVGKSSEILNSSGKARRRTSSDGAQSSLMKSRDSLKLLDTDTSTDEGEKAERRKQRTLELEDLYDKSRERINRMKKSLSSRSPPDLKKSEDEVEVDTMGASEVEAGLDKSRKSPVNKVRKSSTQLPNPEDQKKSGESFEDEVEPKKTSEVEDSNKSRRSLVSESRKSFTRRQSSSNNKEDSSSEEEVEVEDKKTSGIKDNLAKSLTHQGPSSDRKDIASMKDENEVEEKNTLGEVHSSEKKASLASEVKRSSNQRKSSLKKKKKNTCDEEEEEKTSEVDESLALEETTEDEESEVSDGEEPLRIDNKFRRLRNRKRSPRQLAMSREISEEDETSDEVDDRKSSSEASKSDRSPKKSSKILKNRNKIELSSSEDEVEDKADEMLNKSRKSSSASEDSDEVSDDDSESERELRTGSNRDLFKDASTIVQVNSDSEELDESNDDGKRLFPLFIYDADTTESSNSDIEREYNLNGDDQSYSDDNVSYDECRGSETEDEDDDDDDEEDLSDFIDDEEEEEEDDEELEEIPVKTVEVKPKQKTPKIPNKLRRKSEIISTPKIEEEEEVEKPEGSYLETIQVKSQQKKRQIPDKAERKSERILTPKAETKPTDSAKKNKKLNLSVEISKNTSKVYEKPVKPSKLDKFRENHTRRQTMMVDDPDLVDTRILMKEKLNESLPSLKLAECKKIPKEAEIVEKKQKKKNLPKVDEVDQNFSKKASLKRKNPAEDETSKKFILNSVESDSDEEKAEALDALKTLRTIRNVKKLVDENKSKQHYVSPVNKRPIKRLPEEILENISDVPLRPKKRRRIDNVFLPSRRMFDNENDKPENMRIDEEFVPISFSGSTTEFEVVDLKKRRDKKLKGPQTFRERAMNRV